MRDIAESSSFDKLSDYSTLANKESFLESVKKLLN